jgi:hypothetical protein
MSKTPAKKAATKKMTPAKSATELANEVQLVVDGIAEDMVNHPPHYGAHPSGIEAITITEHFNFNVGNAIKYLWRSDHKNGLEDLKKARWYVDREIQRLED